MATDKKSSTSIFDIYPRRFVHSDDLRGQETVITISRVEIENVPNPKSGTLEKKPVIYARGGKKGVFVSRPMAKQLAELLGEDYSQWAGKRVTLYGTTVKAFGKIHSVLRFKPISKQVGVDEGGADGQE